MKNLVILGAGTAGTILANKLVRLLDADEYKIIVIEQSKVHYFQPGFLFIPFGVYKDRHVVKPVNELLSKKVNCVFETAKIIEPEKKRIVLQNDVAIPYDFLIISTGNRIAPEETEGLKESLWQKNIFDFYSLEGAKNLFKFLNDWKGGRLVVNIAEMPIKCPIAPLEFLFLADYFFTQKGIRDKVDIQFATPLSGAFTKPIASKMLSDILIKKNINVINEFNIARVDNSAKTIVSWDEQKIPFDVLITVPINKGNDVIGNSKLGDELNYIPTDRESLRSQKYSDIFIVGDATDLPISKAGAVAHFQVDILVKNLISYIQQKPLEEKYDGHANCYIESGFGKGILIDFNYDTEPLPGTFPFPIFGPFSLLKETRMNHYGKMMFRWIYWNTLLKGYKIPFIEPHMTMSGKKRPY